MGKDKKHPPHTVAGGPKERHRRIPKAQFDPKAPMPTGFEAKPMMPRSKSKHHSYFEFVENTEKKKKLEFQVVTDSLPPCLVHVCSLSDVTEGRPPDSHLMVSTGHDQGDAATRIRVCPHRQSCADESLQGAVARQGCHDLHRLGTWTRLPCLSAPR